MQEVQGSNKKYMVVKMVTARPMLRLSYNLLRGWDLPSDENGEDEGFFIENLDTGAVCWKTREEFLTNYNDVESQEDLSFGLAIEAAKRGCKIARKKWNGKNMFVVYMSGMSLPPFNTQGTYRKVNDRTAKFIGEDKPLNSQPYFAMYNAQEEWVPGWSASQSDMLDTDWYIVG